jgi:hypothetical protein
MFRILHGMRLGAALIGSSSPGRGWEFFSSPPCPDRHWGPPSLLSRGYPELFHWRESGRGMKLTTRFHLLTRSGMCGAIPPPTQYVTWRGDQLKKKHRDNFTFTLANKDVDVLCFVP